MKMKKTDIGVVAFMYLVCAYFYSETIKLKESSQTYPKFTIALLFGLTTLYLVQMLVAARRHGVESGVDEVFKNFLPVQFFFCLGATVLYLVCINYFGFYISTAVFMVSLLLFLKVSPLYTAVTTAVILVLIYFAFSRFLGVRLPAGTLLKALGR